MNLLVSALGFSMLLLCSCAAPLGSGSFDASRACEPGTGRCNGTTLDVCNAEGSDYDSPAFCADYGSANNPGVCANVDCEIAPCCSLVKPFIQFDVSAPVKVTGKSFHSSATSTGALQGPHETIPDGFFRLSFATRQGGKPLSLVVAFERSQFTPGDAIAARGHLDVVYDSPCADWSGSILWISDEPSWSVQVDASCNQTQVRATLSGDY